MKTISFALSALVFVSGVLAAPSVETRTANTFPSSTKKGLGYNTASYTVRLSFRLVQNAPNL